MTSRTISFAHIGYFKGSKTDAYADALGAKKFITRKLQIFTAP